MNSDNIPLRNRPERDSTNLYSNTIHIRGLARIATDQEIKDLISAIHTPVEIDFSLRQKQGQIWARYECSDHARAAISRLHHMNIHGVYLSVKFELGLDENGKRLVDRNSHHTVVRTVCKRKGGSHSAKHNQSSKVSYTHRSIFCGSMEYPFPSGLYLTRVVQLTNLFPRDDALLALIADTETLGNKYGKEISEGMAMGDAVERAVRMVYGQCGSVYTHHKMKSSRTSDMSSIPSIPQDTRVYVLGDGARPLGAACICLHMSYPGANHWRYVSIDPLLDTSTELGHYSSRIELYQGLSQEYSIDSGNTGRTTLSILVACHSHAPLEEFWDRVVSPKVAVTMACCSNYCDLPSEEPIFEYEDFEVYSPKRRIKIYCSTT